ncbi:MAG: hypothetical protein G01um101433_125 [Parcubacteria group bacterium Gr01-1014_33]|nr:MAG: hypothetical protein G01um101433_125 [Parcubacteria group bacterium Gr01-1014_33]
MAMDTSVRNPIEILVAIWYKGDVWYGFIVVAVGFFLILGLAYKLRWWSGIPREEFDAPERMARILTRVVTFPIKFVRFFK